MSAAAVAEGGGGGASEACAVGGFCEGEDLSSVMASLGAMFPALDHEVIATVVQSHDGCLETAVEYLMTMGREEVGGEEEKGHEIEAYHEIHSEFAGQFSEDIGGLPELVPSFIFDPTEEEEEEYLSDDIGGEPELLPTTIHQTIDDMDLFDPLPSYEEACQPPVEVGPPPYPSSAAHPVEASAVITATSACTPEEGEVRGEIMEEPDTAIEEVVSTVMEGGGVHREEGVEFVSPDRAGSLATRSHFEDNFVPAPESRPVHRQHRPQVPLEDDEDEDLTYGDHSKHWTRLDSPTSDPTTPNTSHRRTKKVQKFAGKMRLRRSSKGDYKSQQKRLEASVGAKGPPAMLRNLVDDDEPISD